MTLKISPQLIKNTLTAFIILAILFLIFWTRGESPEAKDWKQTPVGKGINVNADAPRTTSQRSLITDTDLAEINNLNTTKNSNKPDKTKVAKVFEKYTRAFGRNSPINSDWLVDYMANENIDPSLYLTLLIQESNIGVNGRAYQSNNPYNVKNFTRGDGGAVICGNASHCLIDVKEGVKLWVGLIKICYLRPDQPATLESFLSNDLRIQQDSDEKYTVSKLRKYDSTQPNKGDDGYFWNYEIENYSDYYCKGIKGKKYTAAEPFQGHDNYRKIYRDVSNILNN